MMDRNFFLDRLPVWQHREKIKQCNRLVIKSPTGTGKSLVLPTIAAEKVKGRVYVVEPRRIAAISLAKTLKSQGYDAGFQIRHEKDPMTKILYVTDGLFLKKVKHIDPQNDFVILDEFHERRLAYDILYAVLEDYPRLWITTATIDTENLKERGFEVYELPEKRMYHVKVDKRTVKSGNGKWIDAVFQAITDYYYKRRILVFLPGMREIKEVEERLTIYNTQNPRNAKKIVVVHGSLDANEYYDELFGNVPAVLLATNIAETSITPENLDVVISSGYMRENRLTDSGYETLMTVPVSEANFTQQGGRVGRTKPGIHVQIRVGEHPQYPEPEIKRVHLITLVLTLAELGLKPDELNWLDRPNDELLTKAEEDAKRLGLITEDYKLTEKGKWVSWIGGDPYMATILYEFKDKDPEELLKALFVAAVVPEMDRIFFNPKGEEREKQKQIRMQYSNGTYSDWVAAVRALRDFMRIFVIDRREAASFARENYLRYTACRDALLNFTNYITKLKLNLTEMEIQKIEQTVTEFANKGAELGIFWKVENYWRWKYVAQKMNGTERVTEYAFVFPGSLTMGIRFVEGVALKVFSTSKTWITGIHILD